MFTAQRHAGEPLCAAGVRDAWNSQLVQLRMDAGGILPEFVAAL
jgi:hypothetical protein